MKSSISFRHAVELTGLGALCVAGSFAIGIQSAGEVQPIRLIEAGSIELTGDIDGNGMLDLQDVRLILETARGYRQATPQELRNDPNADGALTVDDALQVLSDLSLR